MIKIALIGCGYWGPNYIRVLSSLDQVFLQAICDQNTTVLEAIKRKYPTVDCVASLPDLLNSHKIDAVIIATPATTHFKITKQALLAKKHVLVEKPIAMKTKEAQELFDIARENKVTLMEGHTFIYNNGVIKFKEYLETIGDIHYFHLTRTNLGPIRSDINVLWDLAPHDLSILHFCLGQRPTRVSASGQSYLQKDKHDVCFATLYYDRSIIANLHLSWLDPVKIRKVTAVGNNKMAIFDDLDSFSPVKLYDKMVVFNQTCNTHEEFKSVSQQRTIQKISVDTYEPLKKECQYFVSAVYRQDSLREEQKRSLDVLATLEAIDTSLHRLGLPVDVA